jgi:hypothetical protein
MFKTIPPSEPPLGPSAPKPRIRRQICPSEEKFLHPANTLLFFASCAAGVAQLVEHFLAKEDVESSSLFTRSTPHFRGVDKTGSRRESENRVETTRSSVVHTDEPFHPCFAFSLAECRPDFVLGR